MKKRLVLWILALAVCLTAIPAQAANIFSFTEKSVTLFEGASAATELRREGIYEGEGEITYTSARPGIADVAEDGTITAVSKGQTEVTVTLKRDGKRVGNTAKITVKVLRAVTKVTLNTTKLAVYAPDDPMVAGLLEDRENPAEGEEEPDGNEEEPAEEEAAHQVLLIPAGRTVTLSATCTPEDASSRKVTFTTTDAGVAKVAGTSLKAIQRGECDLIVASEQNPEVTETLRVLVIQPVKKIQIDAGGKTVAAGSLLQLSAACEPGNASITDVVWASKNPKIATVNEDGLVTGVQRGMVSITATAADGSNVVGNVTLNVTQPVESITAAQPEYTVQTGRSVQTKVTILPATASDRSLTWSSSDETIATVKNGTVAGHKAGTCTVTCASKSNPEVTASVTVYVKQLATNIENTNGDEELNLLVGQTVQTRWIVLPEDTTDKSLTFKSRDNRVATVDANGLVTAVGRGVVTISATAADGSRKQGTVKVNVIQPVTGVSIQRALYYVQRGGGANIRAVIEPRNANNQRVLWNSEDESIVTVRSNGTSTGNLYGVSNGYATVTTETEDGGFRASAQVRVGNFNELLVVEDLDVNANNEIKITLRNMSQDITLENIHYKIECFDLGGNPMICNADGESTFFEGDYPYLLPPMERTSHGAFRFRNYAINQPLGSVVLTLLSWKDDNGITWDIQNGENTTRWDRYYYGDDLGPGVG